MGIRLYDEAIYDKIQSWIKDPNMTILRPDQVSRMFQNRADQNNDKPLTLPMIAISRDTSIELDRNTKNPLSFDGVAISSTNKDKIEELRLKIEDNKSKGIIDSTVIKEYDKLVDSSRSVLHMDAIPIWIKYQIDIYTKMFDEADEYVRNFVFQIINHPKLIITIPYNDSKIDHICYMRLEPAIKDNSDISERLFYDQFSRFTLEVTIHDAYLWSTPITTVKNISGDLEVKED